MTGLRAKHVIAGLDLAISVIVMLNSFQHLLDESTNIFEIPKQVRNDEAVGERRRAAATVLEFILPGEGKIDGGLFAATGCPACFVALLGVRHDVAGNYGL